MVLSIIPVKIMQMLLMERILMNIKIILLTRICISKKYTTPIGRAFYVKDMTKFPDIVDNTTINLSNVQFAIGGVNLYLGQTLTKTQFNNLVASQYDGYNGTTHRTARKISPTDL